MSLLEMIGRDQRFVHGPAPRLTPDAQMTVLRLARARGDLSVLRTLASLPSLTGAARTELLAEREPSIRARVFSRADLTEAEVDALLDAEKRTSVLASLASSPLSEEARRRLVAAAADRTALSEALLGRNDLSVEERTVLLATITARKPFLKLSGRAAAAVEANLGGDIDLMLYVVAAGSDGLRPSGWWVRQRLSRFLHGVSGPEQLIDLFDRMVADGDVTSPQQLVELLLHDQLPANTRLPLEQLSVFADHIAGRCAAGTLPERLAATVTAKLDEVAALLPAPASGTTQGAAEPPAPLEQLSTSALAATLQTGRFAPEELVALAVNPNHTDSTAALLRRGLAGSADATLGLLDRLGQVSEPLREALCDISMARSYGSGSSTVTAVQVVERIGVDGAVRVIVDHARVYGYTPVRAVAFLSGNPVLRWLTETPSPDTDAVALRLPAAFTGGCELEALELLVRTIGPDRPELLDAVDGLVGTWDGTLRDLIDTAAAV